MCRADVSNPKIIEAVNRTNLKVFLMTSSDRFKQYLMSLVNDVLLFEDASGARVSANPSAESSLLK